MNEHPGDTTVDRLQVDEEVPVLISGCGPVGLLMSILLSRQGIDNIVLEKRSGVSELPRARGICARTVEILTQLGLGPSVDAISLPPRWLQNFVYRAPIPAWAFLSAALGALLVAFLTILFQTVKAALVNPVEALRSE